MKQAFVFVAAAILMAGIAGCDNDSDSLLTSYAWTLRSWGPNGAEAPIVAGSTITIAFWNDGGCGGSGGCNSYGALFESHGNNLQITDIVSTEMHCESSGISDQESLFFTRLAQVSRFEIIGDTLYLYYGNNDRMVFGTMALM